VDLSLSLGISFASNLGSGMTLTSIEDNSVLTLAPLGTREYCDIKFRNKRESSTESIFSETLKEQTISYLCAIQNA